MYEEIKRGFDSQRVKIKEDIKKTYISIADEISKKPISTITRNMAIIESKVMNNYCLSLLDEVAELSKKIMLNNGISEDAAEIVWSKTRLAVGVPKIELCKDIPIDVDTKVSRPAKVESKNEPKYGAKITVAGVVMEVIGWLLIPGLKTIAAITKTLGIVLIAAGVYVMYKESKEQKPRIELNEEAKENKTREVVDAITKEQVKLNTEIVLEWLDSIADTLCDECEKELQR